jgi:hypothetical protein
MDFGETITSGVTISNKTEYTVNAAKEAKPRVSLVAKLTAAVLPKEKLQAMVARPEETDTLLETMRLLGYMFDVNKTDGLFVNTTRALLVDYLKQHKQSYRMFIVRHTDAANVVEGNYAAYLQSIVNLQTSPLTVQAVADLTGMRIRVHRADPPGWKATDYYPKGVYRSEHDAPLNLATNAKGPHGQYWELFRDEDA